MKTLTLDSHHFVSLNSSNVLIYEDILFAEFRGNL